MPDIIEINPEDRAATQVAPPAGRTSSLAAPALFFAFLAFIPPLCVVALVLGVMAAVRSARFSVRAAVAWFTGGFFTIAYTLMVCGFIAAWLTPPQSRPPGFDFLSRTNPSLSGLVSLMNSGDWFTASRKIDTTRPAGTVSNWASSCASAIIRNTLFDNAGALKDFQQASAQKPDSGEFHYYHGKALLSGSQYPEAIAAFSTALEHEPGMTDAGRYLELAENTYTQSTATTAVGYVIILLLLFTVHEFAHAYSAWRLGDPTALEQGRLTLNPLRHIDIFGSVFLPGIMIWQQAGIVFGWAKPVPVNPSNFSNPRRDQMVVSFAGPAANLVIAAVCLLLMLFVALAIRITSPDALMLNAATPFSPVSVSGVKGAHMLAIHIVFMKQLFYTTLVLGFFNLMPIPPLDGAGLLAGLLPKQFGAIFLKAKPYTFILFIGLIFVFYVLLAFPIGFSWIFLRLALMAMGFG